MQGVLYLHRISDVRMGGAAQRNFSIIQKLCGPDALKNVVLATTRWSEVEQAIGDAREDELRTIFFKVAIDGGARLLRHDRELESARAIVREFFTHTPTTLLLQHEMATEGKSLLDTQAGLELDRNVSSEIKRHERILSEMRKDLEEAIEEHDEELQGGIEEDMEDLRATVARLQEEAEKLRHRQTLSATVQTSEAISGLNTISPTVDLSTPIVVSMIVAGDPAPTLALDEHADRTSTDVPAGVPGTSDSGSAVPDIVITVSRQDSFASVGTGMQQQLADVHSELRDGLRNARDSLAPIDELRDRLGAVDIKVQNLEQKTLKTEAPIMKFFRTMLTRITSLVRGRGLKDE